jgi:hypothetical protein
MSKFSKWFKLHPKVKVALIALLIVDYTAFDDAYNSGSSYQGAVKVAVSTTIVWLVAYFKSSGTSAV